jgi:isoquinoline 1-oxidoreductase subunit beta
MRRRQFLKISGLSGAAFMLGFRSVAAAGIEVLNLSDVASFELTPFVIIEKTGKITIINVRPDIGQGVYQAVPGIIADELEVPMNEINIVQSDGQKRFGGDQFAGGSMSIRSSYEALRMVGASAREMLVSAAAKQWGVPVSECRAENARVLHKSSGRSVCYGEVAEAAAAMEVPKTPRLKDPKDFKIIGKPTPRPDVPLKSSGKAVFGIDAEVPGMVYASIEHCPVFGGKWVSFDDKETLKVKGVQQVINVERTMGIYKTIGVAVIADNYWAAQKGRKALRVQWDFQGKETFNSEKYDATLRDLAKKEGIEEKSKGNFAEAMQQATTRLEALYETPIVSHSPMEPMNCTAHWKANNTVEIWVSTQVPADVVSDMAREHKIPEENIKVNVLFNGGGFGRRLFNDVIGEAVNISKTIKKPVKLLWSREDDTQLGPFRPMTFSAMQAGLDANGRAIAFQHKVISPSIDAGLRADYDKTKPDETMMEAISAQEYQIPNFLNRYVFADFHIPLAYWRAVTSTTLAFSHECFMDEMAVKAGKDPMAYRLDMLAPESDTRRVLQKLKAVSNWDRPLPKGWGRGVAHWLFFAGQCAQVVEVSQTAGGSVKIEKVYAVIDLGTVVNPDTVVAQVEGAIVMAITAATKPGITFAEGRTVQSNYHNNPILRLNETPPIEVHILAEGGSTIKGVGEPGLPPLAPALANAIYNATGRRIRRMPFEL